MFIGAGYAAGGNAVLGYVAACLAVFLAYLRAQGKVAGAHQEFCGPMAKPQRAFTMTVVALYCAVAPAHWHPYLSRVAGERWPSVLVLVDRGRGLDRRAGGCGGSPGAAAAHGRKEGR